MLRLLFFVFGLMLPCVFIVGWTGYSLETNWPFLWVCLPVVLLWIKIRPTPAHLVGALFLVWAGISLLWTPSWNYGFEEAIKLGAVACVFLVGAEIEEDWVFKGLSSGIAINSGFAVFQALGFLTSITPGGLPSGLLFNGNALAEPAALVALVMLLDGRILWALPAAPAILLPMTRSGLLILAAGFFAWLWQRSRWATVYIAINVVAIGLVSLDKGYRLPSTEQRVAIWRDTMDGLTAFGHGLGSFGYLYPHYATRIDTAAERPLRAHSDVLEVTFDLGFPGLILFTAFCMACWLLAQPRERIILCACFAVAIIDFPLHVPTTAFILAFMAGRGAAGWRVNGVVGSDGRSGVATRHAKWRRLRRHRSLGDIPLQSGDPDEARLYG